MLVRKKTGYTDASKETVKKFNFKNVYANLDCQIYASCSNLWHICKTFFTQSHNSIAQLAEQQAQLFHSASIQRQHGCTTTKKTNYWCWRRRG